MYKIIIIKMDEVVNSREIDEKFMILKSVDDIISLYNEFGKSNYIGEKITQVEHALQMANQAEKDKMPKEIIIAGLLHDIGHVIGQKHNLASMGEYGTKHHDLIGSRVLQKVGMCDKVCNLIENHVKVKRYLVSKDLAYYDSLSDASKQTFKHQGGKLTEEEIKEYEEDPNLELYILLRKYDENAKIENMVLPEFQSYRELMVQCFY